MAGSPAASFGTLGLTVAGGYLLGPAGAAAGALLGNFLFGGGSGEVQGPRLGDLSVSASTYGSVIPVGFGVQKVAGAMIWSAPIDEDKDTNTVGGGLLGGGTKVVEYRYFGNFAVAFGEGPASGVLRIWAGEKLIADLEAPNTALDAFDDLADAMAYFVSHSRYRFRIYLGTEDQEPDPLIVRLVRIQDGEEHVVPAHRGLVYVVFEDFPLDEFGNRIPTITAEIAWAAGEELPTRAITAIPDGGVFPNASFTADAGVVDFRRGYRFEYRNGSVPMGGVAGIRRYRIIDGAEDLQRPASEVTVDDLAAQPICVDHEGNLFCERGSVIVKVSGETLTEMYRSGSGAIQVLPKMAHAVAYNMALPVGFLAVCDRIG